MFEPRSTPMHPAIPMRFEETDLTELLRASLDALSEQSAHDGIELRVVTLGVSRPVFVDREKLAWCVATLVGNALRYVKGQRSGGELARTGSVLVHVEHDDRSPDVVAIAVQDDGPGIPDEKLPYLFERRSGALHAEGLSLTLVRQIVSAHGGDVDIESRRGPDEHGTSVTLRLRASIELAST